MVRTLLVPAPPRRRVRKPRLGKLVGGMPTPAQWARIALAGVILLASLLAWYLVSLVYPGG